MVNIAFFGLPTILLLESIHFIYQNSEMAPSVEVQSPVQPPAHYYSTGMRERFRIDGLRTVEAIKPPELYADIQYDVNDAKYLARVKRSLESENLAQDVPPGWPKVVDGPLAWTTRDFVEDEYIYCLTDEEKIEIAKALAYFKGV